ncbi:hypothetical protein GGX14DRAFT_606770 [Mycena pura]|uniref:Uncharacterized protein n=1 Tax=Mycena pura TaxID=153505 RepID=A0AAD6VKK9_9AGAR|nr:hypothetical protein GGX14DRAFT_606770 [Mycena pura]
MAWARTVERVGVVLAVSWVRASGRKGSRRGPTSRHTSCAWCGGYDGDADAEVAREEHDTMGCLQAGTRTSVREMRSSGMRHSGPGARGRGRTDGDMSGRPTVRRSTGGSCEIGECICRLGRGVGLWAEESKGRESIQFLLGSGSHWHTGDIGENSVEGGFRADNSRELDNASA